MPIATSSSPSSLIPAAGTHGPLQGACPAAWTARESATDRAGALGQEGPNCKLAISLLGAVAHLGCRPGPRVYGLGRPSFLTTLLPCAARGRGFPVHPVSSGDRPRIL